MRVYKIEGKGYECNKYLIVGRKNILVDPGMPEGFFPTLEKIENIVKDIDFIINTHCHYDHTGGDYLYQEYFHVPVIIHNEEVEVLKRGSDITLSSLFNSKMIPPKEVIPLEEVLDELKRCNIEVVETPGHTKGSISLICGNYMITGDTLFAYSVGRWDFPTGNLEELKSSILKLHRIIQEKGISKILPGHGEDAHTHNLDVKSLLLRLEF
ncbi:MAG TPA: MBL fold metallo-hydrolase [Methanothermococcus okinawensis]|uniref:Metallo-beta-lactamase domain-containing protein n=1 Tax=Methanofervidicoccus abyssi TaxID=2082189 RepID=A0A401HNT9_9EURY|nr:MBL fold metallo-hydrolase [Methanofervidicoccus abyssi]GBF35900.1 hypothetical protein MHHB_P0125 [Methanofervidicoccus abyssi]HIP15657.1 MBL fold metallo-hydrolase [Methanothermococcus okinawensis]HIP35120.1 MBL fold metallo-hydrolase [Methanothermococcus okinawensis]